MYDINDGVTAPRFYPWSANKIRTNSIQDIIICYNKIEGMKATRIHLCSANKIITNSNISSFSPKAEITLKRNGENRGYDYPLHSNKPRKKSKSSQVMLSE